MTRAALLGALALLAGLQVGVLAYHLSLTVAFPYDLNYGEGYLLNDALRLSRGESLYVDVQGFPMIRSPYPPLFPLVWSAVLPVAGAVFWPGRALSVVSLVALAALVAWNAWRVRCGLWPAVAAVGLVAASPFVYQWAGYARVDLLALGFGAGGVVAAQWLGGTRRGLITAAVLCSLAVWTKQTTITATVAVALALAVRSWRTGVVFGLLVAIPGGLLALALNAASGGQFARHVLEGNATNPVLGERAVVYVGTFIGLHLPALAAGLWWLRRALGRPSPLALYLPITLLAALSAGNGGSSVNYLIEPVLALALVVPFAWRALPQPAAIVGPMLAVTQLAVLAHWPNAFGTTYLGDGALGMTPTAGDSAIGAHLDELVRSERGEIIAEPAGFAVRNKRPVYLQPIDLRAEQLQGRWRSDLLTGALASGRFSEVITAYNYFPGDAERAIQQHFTLTETLPSPDGLTFRIYHYHA